MANEIQPVINVFVKFSYDRLCIDKALGNFRKSDKNNVRSTWRPFPGQERSAG